MANSKRSAAEATFTENFTARVNKEGDHREILLRGEKSNTNMAFRNVSGTAGFENGATYTVTFTKNEPEAAAAEEGTEGTGTSE